MLWRYGAYYMYLSTKFGVKRFLRAGSLLTIGTIFASNYVWK